MPVAVGVSVAVVPAQMLVSFIAMSEANAPEFNVTVTAFRLPVAFSQKLPPDTLM
jgi:hypothetical protein